MKSSQVLMLFGLFFLCFLQIPSSNAKFDKENPIYNVNFAPFIQRLSAYYCLKNVSSDCPGNLTLSVDGWLNVSSSETLAFCQGPCKQHTLDVLKCVWYVKNDYVFDSKATITNIKDTIKNGCAQGFTGISLYKAGGTSTTTSTVTSLSAMALLALFYM